MRKKTEIVVPQIQECTCGKQFKTSEGYKCYGMRRDYYCSQECIAKEYPQKGENKMHTDTGEFQSFESQEALAKALQESKGKLEKMPFGIGTGLEIEGWKFRVESINIENSTIMLKSLGKK